MTHPLNKSLIHLGAAALALTTFAAPVAFASAIDCEPIRILDPYPPGGSTGNLARLVAEKMTKDLDRVVIVENLGGASGNIGSARVARSKPDGCSIVIGNDATHATNYHLFPETGFHPIDDVTPITLAAKNIIVLGVRSDFPANNMAEFIDYAKERPGELFYGSSGIGSPHHLSGPLLNQLSGTELEHAPYQNGPPALADVLGGHIDALFASLSVAQPTLKSGELKALGVTEPERFAGLPDVAAIAETVPGFSMGSWVAFFGPKGMSEDVQSELHESIVKALHSPDIADVLSSMGLMVVASTPEELAIQQKRDFDQRAKLIEENNITME